MSYSQRLLAWYDLSGRKDLPWQQNVTPYRVWLSEIMLQQTQVNTVIDYFQRFTARYPTVNALADASLNDVLALWAGLGYYARARNLYLAAQKIMQQHQGIIPQELNALIALPGIGRSTAAAILSLAYHQAQPILDGNVKRVLTRHRAIEGWPGHRATERQLWHLAESLLPKRRFAHYTQAQMDLGATVCTRNKPNCQQCPIQTDCSAFQSNTIAQFPQKKPKKKIPARQLHWLILMSKNGEILLNQRDKKGIWGGLWSFPEFDHLSELHAFYRPYTDSNSPQLTSFPTIKHIFTHYKLDIFPHLVHSYDYGSMPKLDNTWQWFNPSDVLQLGIPAPVKAFITFRIREVYDAPSPVCEIE